MTLSLRQITPTILSLLTLTVATACNAPGGDPLRFDGVNVGSSTQAQGQGVEALGARTITGETCHSNDPHHICLALHYVVYKDTNNVPVIDSKTVTDNMAAINRVWNHCDLGFQIEKFEEAQPTDKNLAFGAESLNQLDPIRKAFMDPSTLLVVTTGDWGTVKNAWTSMPGSELYGAILESSVGNYPNIIAHELGHYLNLDHVADNSNVMDAIIYPTSTSLDQGQCDAARATAQGLWKAMLR